MKMKTGMLWFDSNDERDLSEKLKRAVIHFRKKYGANPTLCYVHPSAMIGLESRTIEGIEIRGSNMVLPNHMWIGPHEKGRKRRVA
ncbi:MAG: hypothetical protein GYB68_13180 [Chloroflexi bacterium]|nr:hypothetical protein [Chloroflexota bacterium]